jgi:hypothetical protein
MRCEALNIEYRETNSSQKMNNLFYDWVPKHYQLSHKKWSKFLVNQILVHGSSMLAVMSREFSINILSDCIIFYSSLLLSFWWLAKNQITLILCNLILYFWNKFPTQLIQILNRNKLKWIKRSFSMHAFRSHVWHTSQD